MDSSEKLSALLGVPAEKLKIYFDQSKKRTGRDAALCVSQKIESATALVLAELGFTEGSPTPDFDSVARALETSLVSRAEEVRALTETMPGGNEFERAVELARRIARVDKGFFLKRDRAENILRACPPQHVLEYLKAPDVDSLLKEHDVAEVMSALRFMETDEWMHQTFDTAYSSFTADDFEERDLTIRVLSPVWQPVAEAFVKKKHHNVSHLKELGVIFVNPIREDSAAKFLRDFALLFHYVHEVDFYARLFRLYAQGPDFSTKLKSLLRGDVPEKSTLDPGEWLIVQRYLAKIDPRDPRLFLPRVNPESVHWRRAERDLADFSKERGLGLAFWRDLDFVRWLAPDGRAISFDLEDVAMSAVSSGEGGSEFFTYHQAEALWTELFIEFAGGEAEMERLLMENFLKGSIQL